MLNKIVLQKKMKTGKHSMPRLHFVGDMGVSICEPGMEFLFPYYMLEGTLVLHASKERNECSFDVIHKRHKNHLYRVKLRRNCDGLEKSFSLSKSQMNCLIKNKIKSLEIKTMELDKCVI